MLESTRTALLWISGPDGREGSENQLNVNFQAKITVEAIKIKRRWGVDKRIIMTDSLSNIVVQEEKTKGNSKKMVIKDLMAEEGSNLKLMWVPALRMWASKEMKRWTRQHKKKR
jgi:hypothetical protein